MNSFIKGVSLAVLFSLATLSTTAIANQKIAVVNVQQIVQAMPQFAAVDQTIQAEFGTRIQEVTRLRADVNFLLEKLQRERATMSQSQIKELEAEVNAQGQRLQEKGQPLQQEVQQRTEEERRKLLTLIQQAIDNVASKKGYDMVLNANAVPFSSDKYDVSQQVLDIVSKIK